MSRLLFVSIIHKEQNHNSQNAHLTKTEKFIPKWAGKKNIWILSPKQNKPVLNS